MRGAVVVEQTVVERVEDGDKEKKKKRRSNRRSKNNSVCGTVDEIRGEASEGSRSGAKTKNVAPLITHSLSKRQGVDNEHRVTRALNVTFNSMPSMHVNEQVQSCDMQNMENQHVLAVENGERLISKSCPEPLAFGCLPGTYSNNDLLTSQQIEASSHHKIFASHWSMNDVDKALQKGDAFKAVFRVNAHNRLEAYCKIDGVPTDVLINGVAFQNRAVEGDIVAIKVDPLPSWTKMKGSLSNNSPQTEDRNIYTETNEAVGDDYKAKEKIDLHHQNPNLKNRVPLEKINHDDYALTGKASYQEVVGQVNSNYVNGCHPSVVDSSHRGSSENGFMNAVERLCALISSFPLRRPTGRVVAIIERSPRRDTIVGFLNAKHWLQFREGFRKDLKKNACALSISDMYIQLIPTDPRFAKMIVLVRDLPDRIKKRLDTGDQSVEMELVAAQLGDWPEESPFPQANIVDILGRGGEMESQINAILFQNALCSTDFSLESLSCLPSVPWEVPQEEFQHRKDLRNKCVFTIDPSTATDLDDALSVERLSNGIFRVGVHIADVSYFVLPDTALDTEARIRSTSVYMLRSKLPMLPPLLSETVGSLNPGADRLAFSIFWDLTGAGDVIDRWIGRTVIRSCCQLSYEYAQDIIVGNINEETPNNFEKGCPQLHGPFKWHDVVNSVNCLHEISKLLKEKRFKGGALRLESSKLGFLCDEYGVPYDTMLSDRFDSNFLVEEFMLLANRTAAEIISRAFPHSALLRRHPEPNRRKLKEFEAFCLKHGMELDTSSSCELHQSLEKIRERLKNDSVLYDILISYATRPMQLANYFCSGDLKDNVAEWSHYALAVPIYTHFTSPLRRYPDIVVHRTIAATIEAEELYSQRRASGMVVKRFFTGINFDKDAAESIDGREVLSAAAMKYGVPNTELLADVAAHCNERRLACRHVKDACDKLYTWALLKKKKILFSEARVMGLGPKFMSIYIQKFAVERRIYYDEVEGLIAEWLEATSTLVLTLLPYKRSTRKSGAGYYKPLEDVACVINSCDLAVEANLLEDDVTTKPSAIPSDGQDSDTMSKHDIVPGVFPLAVRVLSTIPVALHAIGGDDGPLDFGARLYMSSYLR